MLNIFTLCHVGSSPRMRGKLDFLRKNPGSARLIPAHAGKTLPAASASLSKPAHPRACGENVTSRKESFKLTGSSPRMRGKPPVRRCHRIKSRLIPAHAGKTLSTQLTRSRRWAHPRACGENYGTSGVPYCAMGSSPRMRGKPCPLIPITIHGGLIPAHAGKTSFSRWALMVVRAHPRACGENTERSGVLTLRSVRSWKTLSFPSSLKITHCRAFVQLPFSRIRL